MRTAFDQGTDGAEDAVEALGEELRIAFVKLHAVLGGDLAWGEPQGTGIKYAILDHAPPNRVGSDLRL